MCLTRPLPSVLAVLSLAALQCGCVAIGPCGPSRCCPPRCARPCARTVAQPPTRTPEPTPPSKAKALYDEDGNPADLAQTVASWADVDLVAFGELHYHPVGAKAELAVLEAMAAQPRPMALAMEFFERDMQADLDAYLAGTIDEATFAKRTRRGKRYAASHRPLVEFCKTRNIPVIAANAPRRLVTGYRKSGLPYDEYLASLAEDDRVYLPAETTELDDAYRARFMALMGEERGARIFRSQALWDDAMAEAVARFRDASPEHRVLLVVGGFHVRGGEGTITKYRTRRGNDGVRVIVMDMAQDPGLRFTESDRGAGDLLLKVPYPRKRASP